MVTKKRLPNGKEVWSKVPLPAMARRTICQSRVGFYAFRVCKGKDILENKLYKVQAINIFGFLDDFCDDFTEDFNNGTDAMNFYKTARKEAKKEYERLKEAQQKRIQEG